MYTLQHADNILIEPVNLQRLSVCVVVLAFGVVVFRLKQLLANQPSLVIHIIKWKTLAVCHLSCSTTSWQTQSVMCRYADRHIYIQLALAMPKTPIHVLALFELIVFQFAFFPIVFCHLLRFFLHLLLTIVVTTVAYGLWLRSPTICCWDWETSDDDLVLLLIFCSFADWLRCLQAQLNNLHRITSHRIAFSLRWQCFDYKKAKSLASRYVHELTAYHNKYTIYSYVSDIQECNGTQLNSWQLILTV